MAPSSSSGDSATDRLDIERLSRWMLDQGLPIDPTRKIDVELLARGRSNVTYRLHQDERDWVVRRPPFGHVMPSAHDMSREFRVISGMYAGGFAVPTPIALCEDPEVIGAVFHLMGYVPGLVMGSNPETAHLSPQQARELSLELVGTLARLHGIDAEAVGLGDLGRPEGFLQRQAKRWRQQWELSQTRDQPQAIALVETAAAWRAPELSRPDQCGAATRAVSAAGMGRSGAGGLGATAGCCCLRRGDGERRRSGVCRARS